MAVSLTRRRLLGVGAGLAVGTVTGCTAGSGTSDGSGGEPAREQATCVPRDTLTGHRSLAAAPLVYEVDQRRSTFWFADGFYGQLEDWAVSLGDSLGSPVARWSTYGSWTDGGTSCDSWHNSGRAFDLAALRLEDDTLISCRYDQWRVGRAAAVSTARRRYWTVAAGLHLRFAYVLTYLYNADHANHIHLDNGRSGSQLSQFSTRSRVQVQAVQALLSYRWDAPVDLTGRWDADTRRASRTVLGQLGVDGDLDSDVAHWRTFLIASAVLDRP